VNPTHENRRAVLDMAVPTACGFNPSRVTRIRAAALVALLLMPAIARDGSAAEGKLPDNAPPLSYSAKTPFAWSNPLPFEYTEGQTAPRREVRDPCILREGDRYYLVFTLWPFANREEKRMELPNNGSSPGIALYSSPDLKSWRFEQWLVKSSELPENCPYKHRFWAPEIHQIGGKFYLIFTADNWLKKEYNPAGSWGTAGYAFVGVADKITGPYEHITYIQGAACDTSLFGDADGKTYAVIPRYNIDIQEIDLTGLPRGEVKWVGQPRRVITAENTDIGIAAKPDYLEGPWLEKINGKYYLFYAGIHRDPNHPDWLGYHTGVAVADRVMGPYEKDSRGRIFEGGHLAVFDGPEGDKWFSYRGEARNQARGLLCADPFTLDAEGRVQTVATTVGPRTHTTSNPSAAADTKATDAFLVGADVSWVPQQEAEGRRFSIGGVEDGLLAILKEHGFNAIRLRLFVDPTAPGGYSAKGYCGLESTLAMAERVKAAGMSFLLDFHYSDTWADPAHQVKPAAWRDLDFAALTNRVHDYTRDTLAAFARRGLTPAIVQVGNEISAGLLWPDGKPDDFDQLAALLRAGIRGVREGAPSAQVMLHLALGGQNEKSRWFLDNALRRGVEFDLIGQSYYPRWHGTLEDLKANLTDLANRYRQGIVVVEYSAPDGPQINAIVRSLPAGKGRGSFIWEPTHPGHGRLFDRTGAALPALQDYRRTDPAIEQ